MSPEPRGDDPVPPGLLLDLDEAFRVLEALEDSRLALRQISAAPSLQDELATVIRLLDSRLGFDEGGVPWPIPRSGEVAVVAHQREPVTHGDRREMGVGHEVGPNAVDRHAPAGRPRRLE